jgi:hypothetical protein
MTNTTTLGLMLGRARTNKTGQGSKAVGISVLANVDDKDNAIYGNKDTRYSDEAASNGRALPGTKPARRMAHLHWMTAMTTKMPWL